MVLDLHRSTRNWGAHIPRFLEPPCPPRNMHLVVGVSESVPVVPVSWRRVHGLFCKPQLCTSLLVKEEKSPPSMKSRVSLPHFASLVKSWLVASAGTGTCSDAKLKTPWRAENHLLRGRDPTWRPMGDAIVMRSWMPRNFRWNHAVLAILLSNYPHDLMVEVLSHGFLPLNLAAYLSEGWLAKVEGVETNPWVRFDPFCI